MELRQLRYFIRVVELGSMGRAAADLGMVTSALSQQISRLEGELSVRLLQRTTTGVVPTDAGVAFWRQAQLALRHVDEAARAAQHARLSGHVSVGLAPSTASVLALPFMSGLRARYPDIRLHLVESLSGNLAAMLNARQLDLAVLFETEAAQRWSVTPLLDERLFVVGSPQLTGMPRGQAGPAQGDRSATPHHAEWNPWAAGDRGDGIRAGEKVGAATDLLDEAWWFPAMCWPDGRLQFMLNERMMPSQFVVNGDGKRFINEAAP